MDRTHATQSGETRQGPRWTPRVIVAAIGDKGMLLQELADRWGCSYTTVRRVIGSAPNTFGGDLSRYRRDLADVLGVSYEALSEAWPPAPTGGADAA